VGLAGKAGEARRAGLAGKAGQAGKLQYANTEMHFNLVLRTQNSNGAAIRHGFSSISYKLKR